MTDPIRQYLDARKKYDAASDYADRIVSIVNNVAKALYETPMQFAFSNTSVGLPAEVAFSSSRFGIGANADNWPTATEIQQTLCNVHAARKELQAAYSAIAPDDQKGVQPLPQRYVPKRLALQG